MHAHQLVKALSLLWVHVMHNHNLLELQVKFLALEPISLSMLILYLQSILLKVSTGLERRLLSHRMEDMIRWLKQRKMYQDRVHITQRPK